LSIEHQLKLMRIDTGGGDEGTQAVDGQDAKGEQDPLAQVRNPEDIQKLLKHVWYSASGALPA
jgi:hypothetical protein